MIHCHGITSVKRGLIFIAFLATTSANAALPDCANFPEMESATRAECASATVVHESGSEPLHRALPATPINEALMKFQVDPAPAASGVPESAPLLVLVAALLAVFLVRAKRHNNK
jgi:hypothetical protein